MGKHAKRWTKKRTEADKAKASKAEVYRGSHADRSKVADVDPGVFHEWARLKAPLYRP